MASLVNVSPRMSARAAALGITRALECAARWPRLVVLNYHRIGDPETCTYDPGVYSASAELFDEQISVLKKRFRILRLHEALTQLETGMREPAILLTFDDGYIDNYEQAFPILKSHGVPATFFLATSFIGSGLVPWWDNIAHMVRHTRRDIIRFERTCSLEVDPRDFHTSLRKILKARKAPGMVRTAEFLEELAASSGVDPVETATTPLFMSWEQAREMAEGGMDLGSHTHSHPILTTVSAEEQLEELMTSRTLLRERAGVDATALAYPVGKLHTFSAATIDALRRAGYHAAFSFYGGINRPGRTQPYDILRMAVEYEDSIDQLRLRVYANLAAAHSVLA